MIYVEPGYHGMKTDRQILRRDAPQGVKRLHDPFETALYAPDLIMPTSQFIHGQVDDNLGLGAGSRDFGHPLGNPVCQQTICGDIDDGRAANPI
jgi:hypothetical protein